MIKNILLLAFVCFLYSFGCGTSRKLVFEMPSTVQDQLSTVKFDSSFNIISPIASHAGADGANNTYMFVAKLKDSVMTGKLVKKTSQIGFESTVENFKIYY